MATSSWLDTLHSYWIRLCTIIHSCWTLLTLSAPKTKAFLEAYRNFDYEWDEEQMRKDMGDNYKEVVRQRLVDYYSVLNHLCALGAIEKMYIPPLIDLSKGIMGNQRLFEERMAHDLKIFGKGEGQNILDVGCGRGRIAAHVASISGANVTGINIDETQLSLARSFAKSKRLDNQLDFKYGDINQKFPLPDATFDAAYQVQVFSYSENLAETCAEVARVLKPGGLFALLDWVKLDKFDPNNPEHADLMRHIKPLIGAIGTPSINDFVEALEKAGMEIVINENASIDGLQAPLIEAADNYFTRINAFIQKLVSWGVLPQHLGKLLDRYVLDGRAFVKADRDRLVTTTHYIVARKKHDIQS